MAAKWLKEKGIILEDLRKFIVATEKYLSHQKVLYENRQNDNDYLQQLGRKLTWDMKRKLILQELGIDYQIIGSILVCLAREDENKANCKLEELKKMFIQNRYEELVSIMLEIHPLRNKHTQHDCHICDTPMVYKSIECINGWGDYSFIHRGVWAYVCSHCGERIFPSNTMEMLEAVAKKLYELPKEYRPKIVVMDEGRIKKCANIAKNP